MVEIFFPLRMDLHFRAGSLLQAVLGPELVALHLYLLGGLARTKSRAAHPGGTRSPTSVGSVGLSRCARRMLSS